MNMSHINKEKPKKITACKRLDFQNTKILTEYDQKSRLDTAASFRCDLSLLRAIVGSS